LAIIIGRYICWLSLLVDISVVQYRLSEYWLNSISVCNTSWLWCHHWYIKHLYSDDRRMGKWIV